MSFIGKDGKPQENNQAAEEYNRSGLRNNPLADNFTHSPFTLKGALMTIGLATCFVLGAQIIEGCQDEAIESLFETEEQHESGQKLPDAEGAAPISLTP
jgi:hypothetical protein